MLWNDTIVESNEYYPYGGLFSATASVQPYKYGAKELDRTHGLDLYDSEARWYDSLLGRTSTLDPKAEKYYPISPYSWCASNPVRFVDPSGRFIVSKEFEKEYPRTTYYLKYGIEKVLDYKKIKEALIKYSELSSDNLRNDFKFGKGPIIYATKQIGSYGVTKSLGKKAYITISEDLLYNLEFAVGLERDIMLFLTAVTILHEYVHYGDAQDGKHQGPSVEEGLEFEKAAYGKVVTYTTAQELIEQYLKQIKNENDENKNN